MWVKFLERYNYTPSADRRTSILYKKDYEGPVRAECGLAAIAAGKAERLPTPRRKAKADSE